MKTILIIVAICVVILTIGLNISIQIKYDIYKNIGVMKIKLFSVTIIDAQISLIAGYFNILRKNKKVVQLKINFDDKSIKFVRNLSDNLMQKIYLSDFGLDVAISSCSAYEVSVFAGNLVVVSDLLTTWIYAKNSDTNISRNIDVGYLEEKLKLGFNATIYVSLFDGLWGFSKALLQRRWYG